MTVINNKVNNRLDIELWSRQQRMLPVEHPIGSVDQEQSL